MGDTFLEATVSGEPDHDMVKDLMFGGIKVRSGHLGGDGHADDISGALTEGPGGGFDAYRFPELRVTWSLGMQFAEGFYFFEG